MYHKLGLCCSVLGLALAGSNVASHAQEGSRMMRSAAEFQQSPGYVQSNIPLQEQIYDPSHYVRATDFYGQTGSGTHYHSGYQGYGQQGYAPQAWGQQQPGYAGQQTGYADQQAGYGGQQAGYQQQGDYFDQGQQQDAQRAGLGVSLSGQTDQGVLVVRIHPGSPAQQAGLQPGDRIVVLDGQRIQSVGQAISQIQQRQPGQRIQMRIVRNGQPQDVQATLESRREALVRQFQSRQQQWQQQPQQFGQQQMQPSGQQRFHAGYGQQPMQQPMQQQSMQQQQQLMSQIRNLEQTVNRLENQVTNLQRQLQQTQQGQQQSGYRGLGQQPQQDQPSIQADGTNGNGGNGNGNGNNGNGNNGGANQ